MSIRRAHGWVGVTHPWNSPVSGRGGRAREAVRASQGEGGCEARGLEEVTAGGEGRVVHRDRARWDRSRPRPLAAGRPDHLSQGPPWGSRMKETRARKNGGPGRGSPETGDHGAA